MKLDIVGIDAGGTTGFVRFGGVWERDIGAYLASAFRYTAHKESKNISDEHDVALAIYKEIMMIPHTIVVYEGFVLYGGSHSSEWSGLSPVRINALVEFLLYKEPAFAPTRYLHTQLAAEAKTVQNRQEMKKSLSGCDIQKPHGQDAVLHVIQWLRAHKTILNQMANRNFQYWGVQ